jgi:hypothetical protein
VGLLCIAHVSTETTHAYHACDGLTGTVKDQCLSKPSNFHCPSGQAVNTETGECYTPVGGTGGNSNSGGGNTNSGGGNVNPGTGAGTISLTNPLNSTTIVEFLTKIIEVLLIFALPIIVFFIIFAGFKFVTAQGNESKVTEAKNALTWAIIGGVIILGAKLIITVIEGTIRAF